MKITCLGAAGGEVTGSAYLVETGTSRVLVDCGLFQGGWKAEARNVAPVEPDKEQLDAVVLTHAHLDHTGRLPLLARTGFAGPIYATPASVELTALILRDAAKVQAQDAERENRKRARAGEEPVRPLYSPADAESVIEWLKGVDYGQSLLVAPRVEAVWSDAGHILGSASIQLRVDEDGRTKRIVFSGDLGPRGVPILRDYEPFHSADLVFLESTYGDRNHRPFGETADEFLRIVQMAVAQRGRILVPTFAVGRAQLLTTLLSRMFRTGQVQPFPVFLDSPMAISAMRIYGRHRELFDDDMIAFLGDRPLEEDLKTLRLSETAEDSKRINDQPGPCLVMAGAGMCTAGRILHHLKHGLWQSGTHVVIVGFQGEGTLGRRLVDGEKRVTIHGDPIIVKAQIHTLGGFSAHAGQTDLIGWLDAIAPARPRVVLTHGEDGPRTALAGQIASRFGLTAVLPKLGESIQV